jgi:nicotinamide-nucleotide amidase
VFPPDILESAERLIGVLRATRRKVTAAESCTGGLVAGAITAIAGSSDVFEYGFVTYADAAKAGMIGVDTHLIERHGAVSAEVAEAMAEGALTRAAADLALSITGIAGPGGGSPAKPVGLVFIACAARGLPARVVRYTFGDIGRERVRLASVREGLKLLEGAAG